MNAPGEARQGDNQWANEKQAKARRVPMRTQEKRQIVKSLIEQDFAEVEKRVLVHEDQENLKIEIIPSEGKAVIRFEAPIRIVRSIHNREFIEIEIDGLSAADIDLLFCGMVSRIISQTK
jgi:hypothetical protein